jgi:hypothetical protein
MGPISSQLTDGFGGFSQNLMKKIVLGLLAVAVAAWICVRIAQIDAVSRQISPKRYWKKMILQYQKDLDRARKLEMIKKLQLRKKLLTGELDVAQDVILGIDRELSISMVQSEVEKLKQSIADSERAVQDLEIRVSDAKERFSAI